MNFDDARQDLVGHIFPLWAAAYATYPFIPPNTPPPDLADQVNPFVMMHITYTSGRQASMEYPNPVQRWTGYVLFEVFVREHTGSKTQTQLIDFLTANAGLQNIGGVISQVAVPLSPIHFKGWSKLPLRVPFYFDSIN